MKLNLEKVINYRIILVIWVAIWLLFFVRGFIKVDYKVFKGTFGKSVQEKTAFTMSKGLYAFVLFCEEKIPENSKFQFVYDEKKFDSVESFRMTYYLYPRIATDDPEYIIVAGILNYKKPGFKLLAKFYDDAFILIKDKN